MRKIAISLPKGGVGKSTCSTTLAHGLSLQQKSVLLIDTDDQGQDSFLLGVDPKNGLAEVLNNEISINDAIVEARKNLWLLSGGKSLSACKRLISRKDFGAEQTLSQILRTLTRKFDYCIIDTSPSWDPLTINALFFANEILCPVSMEALTLSSLAEFSTRLESITQYHTKLKISYIVPTFFDQRLKKSHEILEQLQKYYGNLVCEPINSNVRISEGAGIGKTIFECAPNSRGDKDYDALVRRIIGDE
jgi:chromosome partitioning protein